MVIDPPHSDRTLRKSMLNHIECSLVVMFMRLFANVLRLEMHLLTLLLTLCGLTS